MTAIAHFDALAAENDVPNDRSVSGCIESVAGKYDRFDVRVNDAVVDVTRSLGYLSVADWMRPLPRPGDVAQAARFGLLLPDERVIPELIVLLMREAS